MTEAIGLENLFLGTLSGAAIVLLGAFYALFFALGRLHESVALALASLAAYGLLAVAVYGLIHALQLNGIWIAISVTMLIGYFLAPRAIWRLAVGTHGDTTGTDPGTGVSR